MNAILWTLQVLAALLYVASGVMKVVMFDKISVDVPSFAALPRSAWTAMGVLELVCVLGLILPGVLRVQSKLTIVAAALLALESLVFIWVHAQHKESGQIVMSATLGALMAFVAFGRMKLSPLL